jgi:hypothetical protein
VAIPSNVMQWVYAGSLPNGEKWQTSFWFQGNLPTSNAAAAAGAELEMGTEAGATPSAWWNALKAFLPTSITLDYVQINAYPSGGPPAAFSGRSSHAPIAGSAASSANLPNQLAWVLTLLTDSAGRSHRGRAYLPLAGTLWSPTTASLQAAGLTTMLTAFKHYFDDFNAIGQLGVVVSRTLTAATPIRQLRADNRADVQRRRANSQTGILRQTVALV